MEEYCYRCHHLLSPGDTVTIKGKNIRVCSACADDKYEECEECGQHFCSDDIIYPDDSRSICVGCLSKKYVLCPHCGSFFLTEHAVKFHGYMMCRECRDGFFKECDGCHRKFDGDDLEEIRQEEKKLNLCPSCRQDKYVLCKDCREWIPVSESFPVDDETYCKSCAETYCEVCGSCGKLTPSDDVEYVTIKGESVPVCPQCYDHFQECDECGDMFPESELAPLGSGFFCPDCLQHAIKEAEREKRAAKKKLGAAAAGAILGWKAGDSLFGKSSGNSDSGDVPSWVEGYDDDYVGDGLDGNDDYLGDGLDN